MPRTAYEVQTDFGLSCGLRSEIVWDSLLADQAHILRQKLEAIFVNSSGRNQSSMAQRLKQMFENIWQQRKYNNGVLLSSIVYVLVITPQPNEYLLDATCYSVHPVFRTRKCTNASNSNGCCMIFIDEHARVYKNWQAFVENNILPKGIMLAPTNGIYMFNAKEELLLETMHTPAASKKAKIIQRTDVAANVGSLAATIPIALSLLTPVAAPVVAAAGVVGMGTAGYCMVRSALNLKDRNDHKQTLALNDRESRNNWLGVAGGVLGLGASGATKTLTLASNAGMEITMASKVLVNGINVSSIILSGTGIVNGVYDVFLKLHDEEQIQALDLLQLASSLLIFTHSINNLKMASKVATTNNRRNELISQLKKRMQKSVPSNTRVSGSHDVIRTLNDFPIGGAIAGLQNCGSQVTSSTSANPLLALLSKVDDSNMNMELLAREFGEFFVRHILNFRNFHDLVQSIGLYMCPRAGTFLLNLARNFIDNNVNEIERSLRTRVSTESIIYRILMQCIQNYRNFSYEYLESKTSQILDDLQKYFAALIPANTLGKRIKCPDCSGHYSITML